jgi:hypothetical protein
MGGGVPTAKADPSGQKAACGMTIFVFGENGEVAARHEGLVGMLNGKADPSGQTAACGMTVILFFARRGFVA